LTENDATIVVVFAYCFVWEESCEPIVGVMAERKFGTTHRAKASFRAASERFRVHRVIPWGLLYRKMRNRDPNRFYQVLMLSSMNVFCLWYKNVVKTVNLDGLDSQAKSRKQSSPPFTGLNHVGLSWRLDD
jgi:hypothetical protein